MKEKRNQRRNVYEDNFCWILGKKQWVERYQNNRSERLKGDCFKPTKNYWRDENFFVNNV